MDVVITLGATWCACGIAGFLLALWNNRNDPPDAKDPPMLELLMFAIVFGPLVLLMAIFGSVDE